MLDFIQQPGETIFVPNGWHHIVLNLEWTVAVTHNFISTACVEDAHTQLCREDPSTAAAWLRANATVGQRPDLAALLSDLLPPPLAAEGARGGGGGGAGATATLFVCGPAPLTSAASELAYRCGATFHSEVFHF